MDGDTGLEGEASHVTNTAIVTICGWQTGHMETQAGIGFKGDIQAET